MEWIEKFPHRAKKQGLQQKWVLDEGSVFFFFLLGVSEAILLSLERFAQRFSLLANHATSLFSPKEKKKKKKNSISFSF